ncbi:hypothetical protein ON010_g17589 [Phytophthora cinnamomi]|nr:hypothetical protein ON010_g17589 [Phytophthora cinnamomi]
MPAEGIEAEMATSLWYFIKYVTYYVIPYIFSIISPIEDEDVGQGGVEARTRTALRAEAGLRGGHDAAVRLAHTVWGARAVPTRCGSRRLRSSRRDSTLRSAFVQLDCDQETEAFLDVRTALCSLVLGLLHRLTLWCATTGAACLQTCTGGSLWESLGSTVLGLFYSLTDANGILGRK